MKEISKKKLTNEVLNSLDANRKPETCVMCGRIIRYYDCMREDKKGLYCKVMCYSNFGKSERKIIDFIKTDKELNDAGYERGYNTDLVFKIE